ncbi:ribosome-associated toxin RatA of RatAB toxin-antitoxin module [Nocardioides daedukensis]|uniref:Ribosome-associated toxin RatA of RatAB toxin-antitoxin module n=1 Tax=Nocardioides daedukensis TaxID=634462 RepID=A0A7Y9UQN0_9ACTN|nr:SRPBCC family protein [Nocardioides daedukensis]NYG59457.1 ribosome-associated toxin RatA of RatAB toxin-antitoxin module [Nocardioides daedukensis]
MPQITATVVVPVDPATAFALSQTTGELRLKWDPFIRKQHFLDGATAPGKGVRTLTKARVGPTMISQYAAWRPPNSVGMTMVKGPWFFASFGGGWRFKEAADGSTEATWKYTYSIRPSWLRFIAEPIGQWLLGREIRARIAAWARACEDPVVLAAAAERDLT